MTQQERVKELEGTIRYLHEKEGRSKNYIAKLLDISRKSVSDAIAEWGLIKADERHLKPSTKKFLNKHRQEIINMLDSDTLMTEISSRLGISRKSLYDTYIRNDRELTHHFNLWQERKARRHLNSVEQKKNISSREYDVPDLEGEEWRDILGYPAYQVSNKGRVRRLSKRYDSYYLVKPAQNAVTGRIYVALQCDRKRANLSLARLVAFAFCTGHDSEHNTVDHIDGDVQNNYSDNLDWVSQGENNARAYRLGKKKSVAYTRADGIKKYVLDDRFEFTTIAALARFLGISETQASRYIFEGKSNHKIECIR